MSGCVSFRRLEKTAVLTWLDGWRHVTAMKPFEFAHLSVSPFLPVIHRQVRRRLIELTRGGGAVRLLDVGGRKSNYTIGVRARVVISDLARHSELQHELHLGITTGIAQQVLRRRSNVSGVVFDDMTRSAFKDNTFDCVVAVEVIEHVEQDREFIDEVWRVLRPGGRFLLTTPNGECIPNDNPDHYRHYTRQQLADLLRRRFSHIAVEYAVARGKYRLWGLQSWSLKRPLQTGRSMLGNMINSFQSRHVGPEGRHLLAVSTKATHSERLQTASGMP